MTLKDMLDRALPESRSELSEHLERIRRVEGRLMGTVGLAYTDDQMEAYLEQREVPDVIYNGMEVYAAPNLCEHEGYQPNQIVITIQPLNLGELMIESRLGQFDWKEALTEIETRVAEAYGDGPWSFERQPLYTDVGYQVICTMGSE